jgi:hypothetical protein
VRSTTNTMSMAFLLTLLVMLVQGCASDHPATSKMMSPKKMIIDIMTIEKADKVTVVIEGDQPLTYTFMQQESPQTLVLKFADTGFDGLPAVYFPAENFAVHSIQTETPEDGMEARVVLRLKGRTPYQLVPEENSLKVVFIQTAASAQSAFSLPDLQAARQPPPSPATQTAPVSGIFKEVHVASHGASSPADLQAARQPSSSLATQIVPVSGIFKDVQVTSHGAGVEVYLQVDGRLGNYKTFTIDDPLPARIVVDLLDLRSAFRGEGKIPVEGEIVKRVRHFGHPDKVRVVVETQKAYLKDFSVGPVETGLVLKIGASAKNEN